MAGLVLGISGLHLIVIGEGEINTAAISYLEWATGATPEAIVETFQGPLTIVLERYAETGVGLLLFAIGLESNLDDLLKVGFQSVAVAVTGVILSFVLGFLGLNLLFDVPTLSALFAGAALTATRIGITAKVLQDIGALKSQEGQIILGASVIDDILGIADTGNLELSSIASIAASAIAFIVATVALTRFFGQWFVTRLEALKNPGSLEIGAIILVVVMAFFARLIGLESILGTFAVGFILGGTQRRELLIEKSQLLVMIFSTFFFVSIGATTDLSYLNPTVAANREGLAIAVFLIGIGIVAKLGAGFATFTSEKVNRVAIGTGMIPRGEVGLVFARLGAATGALTAGLDVAIVLMVIATTFIAPPLLRIAFQPTEEPAVE